MFDNISTVIIAKYTGLYLGSTLMGFASIGLQLQQRHQYMQLDLPLWLFLIATIVLIFAGAAFSLGTDTMRDESGKVGKYFTAIAVGTVSTFVVLPLIITEPNPIWIMFTGVTTSFSGTILLYLLTKVLQDKKLHEAIIDIMTNAIKDFVVGFIERIRAVWEAIKHGKDK